MGYISNPRALRTITGAEDFTADEQRLRNQAMAVGEQIVLEGCVLLKNDALLPLSVQKVNVFGALAAQPYFGGRGSSCADNSFATGLFTAMEEGGISFNPELYNLYKNWVKLGKRTTAPYPPEKETQRFKKASVLSTFVEVFSKPYVAELPVKYLTDEVMSRAAAYSDVAIVVIGRSGSEQHDMTPQELRLLPGERDMLDRVCTAFHQVLVLLNTAGIFELGFLEEYPSIRAALSIGYVARTGMRSVIRILKGEASPSGRLTDTFYYHTTDHPAYPNTGSHKYTNARNRYFLNYKEDIYVGYRYTETFLPEEQYRERVQFPFGYGLSYTQFEWSAPELVVTAEAVQVSVCVTNVGALAGKDVVELYVRAPYTGRVEKADRVLASFGKTKLLAPGEQQTLAISFPLYDIMSYSVADAGWLLEKGDYELLLSRDAHTAVLTMTFSCPKEQLLSSDPATGAPVVNRFGMYEGSFHRLCRKDGAGAMPAAPSPEEHTAPDPIVQFMKDVPMACGGEAVTMNAEVTILLPELKDAEWADPRWDTFLDQFTLDEMIHLITYGGYQTSANDRLGIPETIASDGPAGIHDSVTARSGISYPSGTTVASTWNTELAAAYGEAIGNEAGFMHVQEWYGPSMNLHRSPFGGRCFEYYSEDPLLSGRMAAAVVRGAQSRGLACHIKHFALNEEDQHRLNVHTWCSEQAIREIYCRPFEYAVKEGGAVGVMSALNCLGSEWCGESKSLLTGLLREEWGFHGCVVTDYAAAQYQRTQTGVPAGNDLWLAPMGNAQYEKSLRAAYEADPGGMGRSLRASVKNICWMVLRTNLYSVLPR